MFTRLRRLLFVFLLCGVFSLFNAVVGLGVSVGVPFTQSNVTVAGSIGAKEKTVGGLPTYAKDTVAGSQNFINNPTTLTVGPRSESASS